MRRLWKWLGLSAVLATGCYVGAYYDPYYYDSVYYSPYWYGYGAGFVYSWYSPVGVVIVGLNGTGTGTGAQTQAIDLNATAAQIAKDANDTVFSPAGCAHATASGATVSYAFSDCTGPEGMRTINGQMTVTLADDNGQLRVTATSNALQVNGKPFFVDSVSTLTSSGNQRTASVISHSRDPNQADSRQAQFTVSWSEGSNCVQVDGQDTTTRGNLSATGTLAGYQRCTARCPTAGKMTVSNTDGPFTGSFDGSPTLKVVGPNGDTKDYQLQCP